MALFLCEIRVSTVTYAHILEQCKYLADCRQMSYVCVANVHMLVEAHNDKTFAKVVNNANIVTPDGMPLVWGLRLLYGIRQERVAGMDLLPDLLRIAEKERLTVFFYGGTSEMLRKTDSYLQIHFPTLVNKHFYSPPFRSLTAEEEEGVVKLINDAGAHFVFVVLGCPKQEKWMASMIGRVKACMIGIGGALPVMIGLQKRAPRWMQSAGLEWLFRMAQEPKRLFKRYAVTNTFFLWLLFKAWANQGFRARPIKPTDASGSACCES